MRAALLLASCALSLGLTGCSGRPVESVDGSPTAPASRVVEVSRTQVYTSLAQLAADSQAVVVARVTDDIRLEPADEESRSGLQATVTRVDVIEVVMGEIGRQLDVRLLTSPGAGADLPEPLESGTTYVLALAPFEFRKGERTGQWTVPGGAGIYRVLESGELTLTSNLDPLPSEFPSLAAAKKAFAG